MAMNIMPMCICDKFPSHRQQTVTVYMYNTIYYVIEAI